MPNRLGDNKPRTIIVRRSAGGDAGHHGGAWKIAYADFVTAMMAFFLVMWLINATTEQRRRGIASFFNPMMATGNSGAQALSEPGTATNSSTKNEANDKSPAASAEGQKIVQAKAANEAALIPRGIAPGKGGVPAKSGGFGPDVGTVIGDSAAPAGKVPALRGTITAPSPTFPDRSIGRVTNAPPDIVRIVPLGGQKSGDSTSIGDGQAGAKMEQADLEQDARQLRAALNADPEGAQLGPQVSVSVAPEGLKIQLSESEQKPMFDTGSAHLNDRAAHLLQLVAPYLTAMPQTLSIYGYTDGAIFKNARSSNWTLSSARADSARQVLALAGFPEQRLEEVAGRADRELAVTDDPGAAANRRVVLVLNRQYGRGTQSADAQTGQTTQTDGTASDPQSAP